MAALPSDGAWPPRAGPVPRPVPEAGWAWGPGTPGVPWAPEMAALPSAGAWAPPAGPVRRAVPEAGWAWGTGPAPLGVPSASRAARAPPAASGLAAALAALAASV